MVRGRSGRDGGSGDLLPAVDRAVGPVVGGRFGALRADGGLG
ncbi:hypothetical protein [Amycolatopsis thermophila]|uniref:Uncharacterized protein n=1 Tax=Amycolatopsis thermophila TaxID=206084 RepID=A0ABU0EWU0_9PSEU|nr:hypothetical protein [Amycolatopsis thermophila]MDQ0379789.1 hypothetical protein [Amycolatopsis thermophila]